MTAKQFNQIFLELQAYAGQYGIKLTKIKETVGVFPKGLQEIGVSGFGEVTEEAAKAGFAARHELAHLFHVIQTRATLIKSIARGGKIEGAAAKEAESFLRLIENGSNYREFEKVVTGISSPVSGLSSRASDVQLYVERIRALLDYTNRGLKAGKVVFPNGLAYEQVYALFISKAPLLVGKSGKELILRFPFLVFGTLYAANTDVSAYGIKIPPELGLKPGAGLRDLVNALIAEEARDRGW